MAQASSSKKKVIDSKDLLMSSLSKFYMTKSNIQKIVSVVEGQSDVSLRLVDWFVTNYSKKHNTVITRQVSNNIIHFNVYLSYRSQLKAYSKQLFDPFRRRERITFVYDTQNNKFETTIGQLNFFRWIIQNDILDYIRTHFKEIEDDMINTQRDNQAKKNTDAKKETVVTTTATSSTASKKRNLLSKSCINNLNLMQGRHVVAFDWGRKQV